MKASQLIAALSQFPPGEDVDIDALFARHIATPPQQPAQTTPAVGQSVVKLVTQFAGDIADDTMLSEGLRSWALEVLAAVQADAAQPAGVETNIADSRCHYLSNKGSVCNKCGRLHDGGSVTIANNLTVKP